MYLNAKPQPKSASKSMEKPTRTLKAMTVRWVCPRSRTRKNRPLPKLTRMTSITASIRKLYMLRRGWL